MAHIKTTGGSNGGGDGFVLLPTDIYRMKVIKSVYGDNPFADLEKDGTKPKQITLTWEVSELTQDQADEAEALGEDWDTATVPQYIKPFYGDVKAGGPSVFKGLVDSLVAQNLIPEFDPDDFDTDSFLGIEQRVNVQKYTKQQGENSGKPGNKVIDVLPIKAARTRKPVTEAQPARRRVEPMEEVDVPVL